MTILNKYALAFSAVALMVACSSEKDDYGYEKGKWNADNNYANIAFEAENTAIELDPADETSATVKVIRKNTVGECVVPMEIVENTDNVFTVSDAAFADGNSVAEVKIDFPNAEVGKPYTLKMTVTDPKFVSAYSDSVFYTFTVTRVKWNPAGYVMDGDKKVEGYAMYTEDIISSYWVIEQLTYPVRLEERDDIPGYYRIVNPYSEYWKYSAYADASKDYYIYIDATDPDYAFLTNGLTDLGVNINDKGTHEVLSFVNYVADDKGYNLSDPDQLDKFKKDYPQYGGTYKNGMITFPVQSLLQAVGGDGYYYANSHGKFCLLIDPSKNPYIASIEDDFEWNLFGKGSWTFTSNKLGTSTDVELYKGTCFTTTDDCDKRFAEEWGEVFQLASPYAEEYNLVFSVKNNEVLVPTGYEYQPIGIKALGDDIYAHINIAHSTFAEKEIVLNITFTNADGTMEFGTSDEQLSNIQWNSLGLGTMTDDIIIPLFSKKPFTYEVEIQEKEDEAGMYRLVDPFGPNVYPYHSAISKSGYTMPSAGKYLVINAVDPEGVYVPHQDLGIDLGDGPIGFLTEAAADLDDGYGLELLKQYGLTGWIADGVINFPVLETEENSGDFYQGFLSENGKLAYYAGKNGLFQITLPKTAASAKAMNSSKSKDYVTSLPKKANKIKAPFKKSLKKALGFNTKKATDFNKSFMKAF